MGSLRRVEFNSKIIYPKTSEELDNENQSWRSVTGDPKYYIPPGDICLSDEISFYPLPESDGTQYNIVSESENYGVIVQVGDDSYDEFTQEEGIIVSTNSEDVRFSQEQGPLIDMYSPVNNALIYAAKYPKDLHNQNSYYLIDVHRHLYS